MDWIGPRACPRSAHQQSAASRVYPTCGVKPGNDGSERIRAEHALDWEYLMSRSKLLILQFLVAAVAVLLWHVFTTIPIAGVKLLPPFFFSTPSDVALRIVKWFAEGTIWRHLWITLIE